MRRLSIALLISCLFLTGATVYDEDRWVALYENPTTSITFASNSNNTSYREARSGEVYLVPRDAFSSTWFYDSFAPGGAQFQAVLWSSAEQWIAPMDSFRGITVNFPVSTGPIGIYTVSADAGFIGIVPDAAETSYNVIASRIYRIRHGYSAVSGTYVLMESSGQFLTESGDYILME